MNREDYIKNLEVPKHQVDVVLDSDMFNEVDDQFALSYLLLNREKINLKAILAAPFLNKKVNSPKEGMELSYQEIFKILDLCLGDNEKPEVYKGSEEFLKDENTPVISDASNYLAKFAMNYSKENPLYIVAIGASTNISSAILLNPEIEERIVVVMLGGEAYHYRGNKEFNVRQDFASARVLFKSQCPLVQLPCRGVVNMFSTSRYELEHWLVGKNKLSTYLAQNAIDHCEALFPNKPWSKPLWDVTAAAWLLNDDEKFMMERIVDSRVMNYDGTYSDEIGKPIKYIFFIKRDALFEDLIDKLGGISKC